MTKCSLVFLSMLYCEDPSSRSQLMWRMSLKFVGKPISDFDSLRFNALPSENNTYLTFTNASLKNAKTYFAYLISYFSKQKERRALRIRRRSSYHIEISSRKNSLNGFRLSATNYLLPEIVLQCERMFREFGSVRYLPF